MVQLNNMMSILIVIAVAAAIALQSTEAADHIVGSSTGWTDSPPSGASFYSNWASNITFQQNDVLVFDFVNGTHNVAELTKTNFDSCNVNQTIQLISTSPSRVTLNRTGEFYFSCTFQGHCNNGQKLSVNVTTTGSSSPPPAPGTASPPPSGSNEGEAPPPSSPTDPGAATPPSPGSATTLAVASTSSLLLITVVNHMLF